MPATAATATDPVAAIAVTEMASAHALRFSTKVLSAVGTTTLENIDRFGGELQELLGRGRNLSEAEPITCG
jgi:hypothetical protein